MALHQILHMRGVVASHVMLALAKAVVALKQPTNEESVKTGGLVDVVAVAVVVIVLVDTESCAP